MAIYTVSSVNIGDDIRDDLGDTDSADYDWEDTAIKRFIARAVKLYSRHAPYYKDGTLTTVAGQDLYALPNDCVKLVRCDYRLSTVPWLTGLDEYAGLVSTMFPYWFQDYEFRSLIIARDKLLQVHNELGRGVWRQITYTVSYAGGQHVLLYPAPADAGDTIDIRYTCVHPRQADDYFTIPAADSEDIQKLTVSLILDAKANLLEQQAQDYDAGTTRVRWGGGPAGLRRRAAGLKAEVLARFKEVVLVRS